MLCSLKPRGDKLVSGRVELGKCFETGVEGLKCAGVCTVLGSRRLQAIV